MVDGQASVAARSGRDVARQAVLTMARASALAPRRGPAVMVIGYHHIGEARPRSVPPAVFHSHMACLASGELGPVLRIDQVEQWLVDAGPRDHAVAVTFDDGFRDTLTTAAPILARFDIPAAAYIPTELIGRDGHLTSAEIRNLSNAGWLIGCHAHAHMDMRTFAPEALTTEIALARRTLERIVDRQVTEFAYPFGASNDRVRRAVADAGFLHALTTVRAFTRLGCDAFAMPRNFIGAHDVPTFRSVVRGGLNYTRPLRRVYAGDWGRPETAAPVAPLGGGSREDAAVDRDPVSARGRSSTARA